MANKKFLGFHLVNASAEGFNLASLTGDYLYFVRTNSGKTDGYLYFNGKKYGTGEDVKSSIEAFIGTPLVMTGAGEGGADATATTVSQYISWAVSKAVSDKNVSATGDTLVSATASSNTVTVAATEALNTAVSNANSAVQSVNEKTGTAVTINAEDIAVASAFTSGETTVIAEGTKVDSVLEDIYAKLAEASDASYTGVTSTGNSVTVTATDNGHNIEVSRETATDDTKSAGHIALEQNTDGALYGVMYYFGNDVE